LGIEILPGISGDEILYGEDGDQVIGIRTGDMGIDKEGEMKDTFEPGIDIMAK
jgi:electron-transferring-flavoprotein dehydrogenase